MNNIGKRLMPIYLIKFLEENYFDIIPDNFGKRMVSRQFIAEIKALYDEFDGKPIDNYGRRMVPEYLIKAFSDIEYIEYTDDDVKYEKTVPSGALKYATLDMLGGMSYKCYNLIDLQTFTKYTRLSDSSIEITNYGNGLKINNKNNAYSQRNYIQINVNVKSGKTYNLSYVKTLISGVDTLNATYVNMVSVNEPITDYDSNYSSPTELTTITATTDYLLVVISTAGNSNQFEIAITDFVLYEGSTALPYQPYFEGVRDSAVTSVVAKKTYEIDEHIQALIGYGQSNPDDSTKYNYIDFESKKFVEVGYIDNEEWVQLETAVETDISDYIKDNFIEVEPTGSITFTNEYEQAVPSEVTYLIKE